MGPGNKLETSTGSVTDDRYERQLLAARETFGDAWAIVETHGGLLAVPVGTPLVFGATVDSLVMKLRSLTDSRPAG